jgi:hypothetical protein
VADALSNFLPYAELNFGHQGCIAGSFSQELKDHSSLEMGRMGGKNEGNSSEREGGVH